MDDNPIRSDDEGEFFMIQLYDQIDVDIEKEK